MQDNRGEAMRGERVVVADAATRVDTPRIIRATAVSRTQTHILRFSLRPIYLL